MEVNVPVLIVVGLAAVTLIAIIVAPSRKVRAERPLPADVQARVLLGQSPREIDAEMESPEDATPEHSPPTAS